MAKTLILIDDDPDDLDIVKQSLALIDSSVVCISFIYPEEALRVLLSKELVVVPDVILMDINMPGLTGDKCLKALRADELFNNTFIAMYSTSMPETVSNTLKQLGANYTFEKPVRMASYEKLLAEILNQT